jgi:hypothetical protein
MTWWKDPKYDIAGKRFGRLLVIKKLNDKGRGRFSCLCDCGNFTDVARNNLVTGNVISCGCALKGCNRKRPYEWLYNQLMSVALREECDITYDCFVEFTKETKCHYCDGPIVWQEYAHNREKNTRAYNLDRKNNDKGYLRENVVVCCPSCNWTKGDRFTYEQFVKIGEVIKTFAR